MCNNRPQPINNLFNLFSKKDYRFAPLLKIQRHATLLLKINRAINELLPESIRPWCRVANIRHKVLILEVASASWKFRLNFERSQLLSASKARILPFFSSIDIRINPGLARKQLLTMKNSNQNYQADNPFLNKKKLRHKMVRQFLSEKSAESIRHLALQNNGRVKNALERLASLSERRSIN
ncbi:DUF721 domain-containing protein [Sodalis sp. CWE]|uniref:DUF721 domain-containing protein n=1 Tax=Sodalis sp. CWE TaxID=2803816 RepID=UPI001C7D6079|nr:DciA family protein [Sodalis sp. CWE]MBX4180702.1 DUF721 domain-containing protein [Sodalis sp. CWE]